jgi:hypothetical protein
MPVNTPCRWGWYLYALLVGISSLILPLRLHRAFFALLQALGAPTLGISALTGFANLCWYELAYVIAGAFKNSTLFTVIPFVGSATGLLSVMLLLARSRTGLAMVRAHLSFGLILGLGSLLILLSRLWRGFADPWRLVTTTAFILAYLGWTLYFRRIGDSKKDP